MRYGDQLARHHPFKIVPPIEFAPFAHRSIVEVQNLLRRSGLKKTDPHRIAQLFDIHLNELVSHFSRSQKSRSRLLSLGYPAGAKAEILTTRNVDHLRTLVPDLDLYKARQFMVPHLVDVPTGFGQIPAFVKVGVLALWKVADAIDVVARVKVPSRAARKALPIMMQAIDAARFTMLLFESEVSAMEESAAVASAQAEGASQEQAHVKLEKSIEGKLKNKKRLEHYDKAKAIALVLVKELRIRSLKEARLTLPSELSKQAKGVSESTIRDWFTGYDFKKQEFKAKKGKPAAGGEGPRHGRMIPIR